ncbi:MAG: AmmeMemoRadiSam system protein A [Clostridiales bacterium]|nr:AmmeMemoRadiSam system protein A [Clostridiales bacterium]
MAIVFAMAVPHPPLIIPEVGRGEEREIQSTIDGYTEAARRAAAYNPDTVVVLSPHSTVYSDYFHISPGTSARGDFGRFGARRVSVEMEYDAEFVRELSAMAEKEGLPAGVLGERERELDHGTLVPLYFLGQFNLRAKLVRIGISGLSFLDHYRLGKMIARVSGKLGRRTVFVASGDLSHRLKADGPYGFAEEGPEFDRQIMDILGSGDFIKMFDFSPAFCDAAGECGLRSFIVMAGALDGLAVKPEKHSYEGPFGVGYGVCTFEITGTDPGREFERVYLESERKKMEQRRAGEDPYVRLARLSLETFIRTGKRAKLPEGLPEEMLSSRAGVFVSIYKHGQLRGCIGTIEPTTSCVAEEILRNAVSSGTEDPRFNRVREIELDDLVYSVDVLTKPEPVQSVSQLDPKRYGVIVSKGFRRGLLLPNLDGVDDVETQLKIAKQKAGIRPDDNDVKIERFEVVRHK